MHFVRKFKMRNKGEKFPRMTTWLVGLMITGCGNSLQDHQDQHSKNQ